MTARVERQDASPQDWEGVLLALRDVKREWSDSLGIEEMGGSFFHLFPPIPVSIPNAIPMRRYSDKW